jgi:hypothetical protein
MNIIILIYRNRKRIEIAAETVADLLQVAAKERKLLSSFEIPGVISEFLAPLEAAAKKTVVRKPKTEKVAETEKEAEND